MRSVGNRSTRSAPGWPGSAVIDQFGLPPQPGARSATKSGWSGARWMRLAPTCSASMATRSRCPSSPAAGARVISVPAARFARRGAQASASSRAQHGRVDVAAGDASATVRPPRQPVAVVQDTPAARDGTARLGHQPACKQQTPGGVGDLVLGDGDDVVHLGADVRPRQLADAERAQPVGHGPGGLRRGPRDPAAGAERLGGVAGQLRLDADRPWRSGSSAVMRGGDPGDQPAAGHRHQHDVDIRHVLRRSPARWCPARRSRRGGRTAGSSPCRSAPASSSGRLNRCSTGTSSTVAPRSRVACDLAGRRVVRDDDVGVDAEARGGVGDRLRVVAGRVREHARRALTSGSSREMAVTAPRILKAPIGCRFSGLSQSPAHGEASSGVRTAYGRISSAASRIRSRSTSGAGAILGAAPRGTG